MKGCTGPDSARAGARRAAARLALPLALGALACLGGDDFSASFGEPWSFVQGVGGMRVGAATRLDDGRVSLEVLCDVSGAEAISQSPTDQNTGLGVRGIRSAVRKHEIFLALNLALGADSHCPPVVLADLAPGSYRVTYRGSDLVAHALNPVEVP